MVLTQQERDKFAAWLEREAESAKAIIEQLEKLGPHGALIAKKEKQEMTAALIIAAKLRSIQSETIG